MRKQASHAPFMAFTALLTGSTLLALGAVEAGARVLGWFQIAEFIPSAECGYLVRPSQTIYSYGHPIVINSLGFRGPEPLPKRRDTTRVLFVGDSITYGGGKIPEAKLFCRIVESQAAQEGLQVEAVNVSVPGWSPQNWRRYVAAEGLLGADVVVLVLPECDLARPFATMQMHGFWEHSPRLRLTSLVLRLHFILDCRLTGCLPNDPSYDAERTVAANVESVRYLRARSRGLGFVAVLVPSAQASPDRKYWSQFEAVLEDPLDLRGELSDERFFLDGAHLSAKGHRLVADRIMERLRGLLRRSGTIERLARGDATPAH